MPQINSEYIKMASPPWKNTLEEALALRRRVEASNSDSNNPILVRTNDLISLPVITMTNRLPAQEDAFGIFRKSERLFLREAIERGAPQRAEITTRHGQGRSRAHLSYNYDVFLVDAYGVGRDLSPTRRRILHFQKLGGDSDIETMPLGNIVEYRKFDRTRVCSVSRFPFFAGADDAYDSEPSNVEVVLGDRRGSVKLEAYGLGIEDFERGLYVERDDRRDFVFERDILMESVDIGSMDGEDLSARCNFYGRDSDAAYSSGVSYVGVLRLVTLRSGDRASTRKFPAEIYGAGVQGGRIGIYAVVQHNGNNRTRQFIPEADIVSN